MSSFPLDNYQKAIVESDSANIVVIAGAGSGKTRVLTERVKRLLNKGVEPSSIVVFTFTVMAAEELKERLSDITGSDRMFIGTIHSYANFILRKYSNVQYELLTDELEHDIMLDLCKHNRIPPITTEIYNDFKSRHYDGGGVYNYITNKYGFNVSEALRHILEFDSNDKFPITIKSIARINNYITFDKLIELATEYFETTGNFVDYLFVDEFQDIGNLEYKFIASLQALSYFIVGDDYQSIYGFKGANPKYFQQLTKKPEWSVYELINNSGLKNIKVFDHHVSHYFAKDYEYTDIRCDIDGIKTCGTELFYLYLKKKYKELDKTNIKEYVDLVRQLDTYTFIDEESAQNLNNLHDLLGHKEFVSAMTKRLKKDKPHFEFTQFEKRFFKVERNKINRYMNSKDSEMKRYIIDGKKCGVVFAESNKSETGNYLSNKYPELDLIILLDASSRISYRTTKEDVDLNEFTSNYGGGGHKKAAGSKFDDKDRQKIIEGYFKKVKIDE